MASWLPNLVSLGGLAAIVLLAFALSERRRKISWRLIGTGIALQLVFAIFILHTSFGVTVFDGFKRFINEILSFADAGGTFVFGSLADGNQGFIFAFQVLTTIVFFASLMAILYHLGVMQWVVWAMAWLMQRVMGVSGAESLSVAANVFVGQTEAPIVVRPFISSMTRSELMALMTGGFATIAGGVLVAYVRFGIDAGHLLSASVMSAPAALVLAKLLVPETEVSKTAGEVKLKIEKTTANVVDAAASGAADGMKLALNVAAMLIAFVALIALADATLGLIKDQLLGLMTPGSAAQLSMQQWWPGRLQEIFGYVFAPLALAMGVPLEDCFAFGGLLGTKVAVNEFVAYLDLKNLIPLSLYAAQFSPRSLTIATYALCGFANFSSIAIQLGGIGGLAPERRQDLARLGLKAMAAGALASFMTAALAGLLITSERSDRDYVKGQLEAYYFSPERDPEVAFGAEYLGRSVFHCDEYLLRHPEGSYRENVLAMREELFAHLNAELQAIEELRAAGGEAWRGRAQALLAGMSIDGLLDEVAGSFLAAELEPLTQQSARAAFVNAVQTGGGLDAAALESFAAPQRERVGELLKTFGSLWQSFELRAQSEELRAALDL